MSKVFVIADTHFGHEGITRVPGRSEMGFANVVEHDEHLIDEWNRVVTKRDKVFLLGDVASTTEHFKYAVLPQLPGNIVLVGGNHDQGTLASLFEKSYGATEYKKAILTHIPIHPQEMWWDINVHGHLHSNIVKKYANSPAAGYLGVPGETDPRYICVSCEHIGYRPVELLPMLQQHREQWGDAIERLSPLPPTRNRR